MDILYQCGPSLSDLILRLLNRYIFFFFINGVERKKWGSQSNCACGMHVVLHPVHSCLAKAMIIPASKNYCYTQVCIDHGFTQDVPVRFTNAHGLVESAK